MKGWVDGRRELTGCATNPRRRRQSAEGRHLEGVVAVEPRPDLARQQVAIGLDRVPQLVIGAAGVLADGRIAAEVGCFGAVASVELEFPGSNRVSGAGRLWGDRRK